MTWKSIKYSDDSFFSDSLSIDLLRKSHDPETGHVTLTFNFIFYPTVGNIQETIVVSVTNVQVAVWPQKSYINFRSSRDQTILRVPNGNSQLNLMFLNLNLTISSDYRAVK